MEIATATAQHTAHNTQYSTALAVLHSDVYIGRTNTQALHRVCCSKLGVVSQQEGVLDAPVLPYRILGIPVSVCMHSRVCLGLGRLELFSLDKT
jgi:hypothetical protein